jgi:cell division protein FtsB
MTQAARQLNREYYAAEEYVYTYPYEVSYDIPYAPSRRVPRVFEEAPVQNGVQLSAQLKKNMLALVIVLGAAFFLFVFMSAYCASIQANINNTNAQVAGIQSEIDALNVELEKSKNIAYITNRAENELGMIYPGESQIIYVDDTAAEPYAG